MTKLNKAIVGVLISFVTMLLVMAEPSYAIRNNIDMAETIRSRSERVRNETGDNFSLMSVAIIQAMTAQKAVKIPGSKMAKSIQL